MKTISEIIPITKAAITSLLRQPKFGPSIIPKRIVLRVTIDNIEPTQSSGVVVVSYDRGTYFAPIIRAKKIIVK